MVFVFEEEDEAETKNLRKIYIIGYFYNCKRGKMKIQKLVVVLLVISIIFSVISLVVNLFEPTDFVKPSEEKSEDKRGGSISLEVLRSPKVFLGVVDEIAK